MYEFSINFLEYLYLAIKATKYSRLILFIRSFGVRKQDFFLNGRLAHRRVSLFMLEHVEDAFFENFCKKTGFRNGTID